MSAPTRPAVTTWGRSARWEPAAVAVPTDVDALAAVLARAARHGRRVKAIGAGHSFPPIAATDGVQVSLDRMAGLVDADPATCLVTLHAGTRLRDVPALLAPYRLAMTNLGDIDSQSVAGAIATGTHGTGARFGGLATQVVGLTLVLADGSVVTCSATERPELFAAARIGLGALGVVASVTLRCEPAFLLHADERPVRWAEMLATFDALTATTDHVEVYWFPHTDGTLCKRNTRLPADAGRAPLPAWRSWLDDEFLSNTVFSAVCGLGRAVPAVIAPLAAVSARALGARAYTDVSHRVLTSPRRVRFREMEYAVPRAALSDALRAVRAVIERRGWRVSFPIEVRVAAADDVWMSTAYGRDTAYVAVHQYVRTPYAAYFRGVEEVLLGFDGRPHWGKLHTLDAAALAARHPRFADFTAVRDAVDPERRFANPHLDRVLGP